MDRPPAQAVTVTDKGKPPKKSSFWHRVLVFFIFLTLLLVIGLYVLKTIFTPEVLEKQFIGSIESELHLDLSYQDVSLSYFPSLGIAFEKAQLDFHEYPRLKLQAEKFLVQINPLMRLIGKTGLSGLRIRKGDIQVPIPSRDLFSYPTVHLQNVHLNLSALDRDVPVEWDGFADVEGHEKALQGEGTLTFPKDQWRLNDFGLLANFQATQFPIKEILDPIAKDKNWQVQSGDFSGQVQVEKTAKLSEVQISTNIEFQDLRYRFYERITSESSATLKGGFESIFKWNFETETLEITRGALLSDMGEIDLGGTLFIATGEFRDIRLAALRVSLEKLSKFILPLKKIVPFNLGFSGLSDLEMSLSGTSDHLAFQGNWDLTPMLLHYGRYFSKPQEVPASVGFSFLLKKGNVLTGDFSSRIDNVTIKGTVTDFDFAKSEGQLNMITNKFDIEGWEELIPSLEDYELHGQAKVFWNLEGSFKDLSDAKLAMNVTVKEGELARKGVLERIENLSMSLDYSPLSLKIKDCHFELAQSPVDFEFVAYNLKQEPQVDMTLKSPVMFPGAFLRRFTGLFGAWLTPEIKQNLEQMQTPLREFFPPIEPVSNIEMNFGVKENKWLFKDISFDAFQGNMNLKGEVDFKPVLPRYNLKLAVQELDLEDFARRDLSQEKSIKGTLFGRLELAGEMIQLSDLWKSPWGQGEFSITSGEFLSFDLMQAVADIEPFRSLETYAVGSTLFTDLRSTFILKDDKFITEDSTLVSKDLRVQIEGEMGMEGESDFRLGAYLSPELTREVLASRVRASRLGVGEQLGPIPFLFTGPWKSPEIKTDPLLLPGLLNQLSRNKTQRILRNFLEEDFFLERIST